MDVTMTSADPVGIGYEGRNLRDFIDAVAAAGVGVVADVRLTPVSRKPGFSKRALDAALTAAGIEYIHLPALGNPKPNRAGFGGTLEERRAARARYRTLLNSGEARKALDHIAGLARQQRIAVLCFEADQRRCHRDRRRRCCW